MNINKIFIIVVALLVFLSCSGKVKTQSITLPNGKQIDVQHIRPWVVRDGTKILILTYITELPLEDLYSVQKEVDQIWPWFQEKAEKVGFKAAGISAGNVVKEGKTKWETRNYTFIFENKEGVWVQYKRMPDPEIQNRSSADR